MKFRTFKEYLEAREKKEKGKIHMTLDVEGEPVIVGGKKKPIKGKLKRVLDIEGEPETI